MTRRELLAAAAERLGRHVHERQLEHALARGYVPRAHKRPNGWADYSHRHLAALVRYVRERGRLSTAPAPTTAAAR